MVPGGVAQGAGYKRAAWAGGDGNMPGLGGGGVFRSLQT